jgi:two-component system LytT family response regulator
MMRTLIVDDEPLARDYLQSLLAENPDIDIVGICKNGREAIAMIRELGPDLVFLDIQMPGLNGFDVVKAIQEDDAMPLFIFATAYDDYAVEAFDLAAVDYVLKPLESSRLARAIERARERHVVVSKGELMSAVDKALGRGTELQPPVSGGLQKLTIRDNGQIQLVDFHDIDWVDAAGDYMCVHVGPITHIMRCTMTDLTQRLSSGPFARIHRSTLVNLDKVTQITPLSKGESLLHLEGDTTLKVSRNYRQSIVHLLN